jgi:hypothetical protein
MHRAKLALTLNNAEHNGLTGAPLLAALAILGVLVLFLAADERRIGLAIAFKRRIERLRTGRMTKAMQHMPRALLRDFQVLRERDRSNPLRMICDKPNGHKPFTERQFRVVKNGADFDRKPLATVPTFERLAIGKVINAIAPAMGAKFTIAPADCPKMINASLFIREGFHQVKEAIEILDHGASSILETSYPIFQFGSTTYIGPNVLNASFSIFSKVIPYKQNKAYRRKGNYHPTNSIMRSHTQK